MAATAQAPAVRDTVVIGPGARMRAVFEFLDVIAGSDSTVLITGESGTGKDLMARLIHEGGRRAHQPYVAVSCALLSETRLESDLFGHERGVWGALNDRPGRFELADGGTLFLDDIDEMPAGVQVRLLGVLQNRAVERLGGTRALPVNVRVIAGSRRQLREMAAAGTFREDLFHRLNVLPLALPPLRDRRDDIPVLATAFLDRFFRARGQTPPPMARGVVQAFMCYDWPGNVRELENACERIAQTCTCGTAGIGCVAAGILFGAGNQAPLAVPPPAELPAAVAPISLDHRMREFEAGLIQWALRASRGNKSKAAELLQVKRSTLGDRIRYCGLDRNGTENPTGAARVDAGM